LHLASHCVHVWRHVGAAGCAHVHDGGGQDHAQVSPVHETVHELGSTGAHDGSQSATGSHSTVRPPPASPGA
jgi:hypothetical protein